LTALVVPGDVYTLAADGPRAPIPMQEPGPACFLHVRGSPVSAARLAEAIAGVEEVSAVAMIAGDHDLMSRSRSGGSRRHR